MQNSPQSEYDISPVPVAAETTSANDDLLRDVMDSMEQGILVWDADAVCVLVNVRVYEVLELSRDDLYPGMCRTEFLQLGVRRGEFKQEVADQAAQKFQSGDPFSFERTMPSGRSIITSVRPREVGGFVVTFSDITDQKSREAEIGVAKERAETAEAELGRQLKNVTVEKAALEQQQDQLARLSMVATHAKDLIAITRNKAQIEWVNKAFSRALGYQLNEVKGRSFLDLLCGQESDSASAVSYTHLTLPTKRIV